MRIRKRRALAGLIAFAAWIPVHWSGARYEAVKARGEAGPAERAQEGAQTPGGLQGGGYVFARMRFTTHRNFAAPQGRGRGFGRGGGPGWAHDYPDADENFVRILDEVSLSRPPMETVIVDAASPELHLYPAVYVAEPGMWAPTSDELENVSGYLRKGGFLILDDFRGEWEWRNVLSIFSALLPGRRFEQLELSDPIFDSFFGIESLDFQPPTFQAYTPSFWGIRDDQGPASRLMVVANRNNDIGDYWEYSGLGYFPVDLSNEAYKVGVNYVIYALTR